MPAYVLPDFNLLADQWVYTNKPSLGPPDRVDIPVQFYINSRDPNSQFDPQIRMASFAVPTVSFNDCFECPKGSGRYYKTQKAEVVHPGFPNEYWGIIVVRCDAALTTQPGNLPS